MKKHYILFLLSSAVELNVAVARCLAGRSVAEVGIVANLRHVGSVLCVRCTAVPERVG